MKKHKEVPLHISSGTIKVDEGIVELVRAMNVPGLMTLNSCQGNSGQDCDTAEGYVQFDGEKWPIFIVCVADGIIAAQAKWEKQHRHTCHGCRGMTVRLEIKGNVFAPFSLHWLPYDYALVLKIVKTAIKNALVKEGQ